MVISRTGLMMYISSVTPSSNDCTLENVLDKILSLFVSTLPMDDAPSLQVVSFIDPSS